MLKNSLIFASGMVTGAVALAGGFALWVRSIDKKARKEAAQEMGTTPSGVF